MKYSLLLFFCFIIYSGAYAQYDSSLAAELEVIMHDDQSVREELNGVRNKYATDTAILRAESGRLFALMNQKDSINILKVSSIINRQGWPAPEVVGKAGSSTPFWVIQHAGIDTQLKYLPLVRQAVKDGKVQGKNLALLEDRVLLGTGKRQLYGTQVGGSMVMDEFYVAPLSDPDNVDKRRVAMGLEPLAEYIAQWKIQWNIEAYKKKLPELDKIYGITEK
jgi:hypothetical protein